MEKRAALPPDLRKLRVELSARHEAPALAAQGRSA
jgi:hypothetical protein